MVVFVYPHGQCGIPSLSESLEALLYISSSTSGILHVNCCSQKEHVHRAVGGRRMNLKGLVKKGICIKGKREYRRKEMVRGNKCKQLSARKAYFSLSLLKGLVATSLSPLSITISQLLL